MFIKKTVFETVKSSIGHPSDIHIDIHVDIGKTSIEKICVMDSYIRKRMEIRIHQKNEIMERGYGQRYPYIQSIHGIRLWDPTMGSNIGGYPYPLSASKITSMRHPYFLKIKLFDTFLLKIKTFSIYSAFFIKFYSAIHIIWFR